MVPLCLLKSRFARKLLSDLIVGLRSVQTVAQLVTLMRILRPGPLRRFVRAEINRRAVDSAAESFCAYPDVPNPWVKFVHYVDKPSLRAKRVTPCYRRSPSYWERVAADYKVMHQLHDTII